MNNDKYAEYKEFSKWANEAEALSRARTGRSIHDHYGLELFHVFREGLTPKQAVDRAAAETAVERLRAKQCTEREPDPEARIHPAAYEVGEQLDGYPGGDIVFYECPYCGISFSAELPQ